MSKDTELKTGALHLRLMDDEEQYSKFLAHLIYYNKDNESYTQDVLTALENGLKNFKRYQKLDNALSTRLIKIEKRVFGNGEKLAANDTEGAYQVLFHFDDDTEEVIHFGRKQSKLLFLLILFSSLKNGFSAQFLFKPERDDYEDEEIYLSAKERYKQTMACFMKLARLIYPVGPLKERIIREMAPEISYTEINQKMRSELKTHLKTFGQNQEEYWFMPYAISVGKRRVYQMHIEPIKIIYPKEFQAIIQEMPLVDEYVDMSGYISEEMEIKHNEELLKGVQEGDIESMNILARAYYDGIGRVADPSKAFSLWQKTADLGDAEGLFYVGVFYGTGDIVSQDYTISTQYFQKSAEQGYADALYQLGLYKLHGFACQADWREALKYCKAAAEKGCADAANEVGYIYDRGEHGVTKDDGKAFEWFLKAAEMNHTEAIRYVIRAYHDGLVEDEDGDGYLYWAGKGIGLEIPEVYLQVGYYMYQDENYEEAFDLFKLASEAGDMVANHILAVMLIKGLGVNRNMERAIDYLREGAYSNDESCLNLLKKVKPDLWKEITSELDDIIDMRETLIELVSQMEPEANQEYFHTLLNSYRECFHDDHLKTINRQLSIHVPSTNGDGGIKRKITVRKSSSKMARYEIVVTLANGEEKLLKFNPNSLVLILLTIICSYKSGYTTLMTLDHTSRSVMAELVKLVFRRVSDAAAFDYIEKYMASPQKGTDSYKTYSKQAKLAIKSAISEFDDAIYFLFDNNETIGRRPLRSMNLDVDNIELPKELMQLAERMPDGKEILYSLEDEAVIME